MRADRFRDRFGLDGEVLRGPAEAPLKPRPVMVRGADVVAD